MVKAKFRKTETSRHSDGRLEVVTLGNQPDPKELLSKGYLKNKVVATLHTEVKDGKAKQVRLPVEQDVDDDEPIIVKRPKAGEYKIFSIVSGRVSSTVPNVNPLRKAIVLDEDGEQPSFAKRNKLPVLVNGSTIPEEWKQKPVVTKGVKLKACFARLFEETRNPIPPSPEQLSAQDKAAASYLKQYPRKQWPPPILTDATPLPSLGLNIWLTEKCQLEMERMLKDMRSLSVRCMQEINEAVRSGKYHCAPPPEIRRRLILSLVQELRENLDEIPQ